MHTVLLQSTGEESVIWSNTEKKSVGKAELALLYKKKVKIKALGPSNVKIREL